jgi:hypothetical protein
MEIFSAGKIPDFIDDIPMGMELRKTRFVGL